MMRESDNRMSRAIVDEDGVSDVLAEASSLGMTSTSIHHDVGCAPGLLNSTSLADLEKVYAAYIDKTHISVPAWRVAFRARMNNEINDPATVDSLCAVVHEQASTLHKPQTLATSFCKKITWIDKSGQYYYSKVLPCAVSAAEASLTALPFKNANHVAAPTYFFYGDYLGGTTINSMDEESAISSARHNAYFEAMPPYIDAALQTW